MSDVIHPTREAWLNAAVIALTPWFLEAGSPLTNPVRVSIGFPSRGALATKRRRIGECWAIGASTDAHSEILITPFLDDPLEVVAILTHELGHAALGTKVGHKRPFAKLMARLDLEGPATATVAGETFRERAADLLADLGPLPHARLTLEVVRGKKKADTCRQLKAECPTCGYLVRVTKKWLDEAGAPICPTDRVALECEGS
jgi:hypothetical protein